MPTAETMNVTRERVERWNECPILQAIVVRHGEPVDRFDEKTKLTTLGEKQFEAFVGSLLVQLDCRPLLDNGSKKPLVIVVDDTDVPRAIQCGLMANFMLEIYKRERQAYDWLTVIYLGGNKALRPAGAIKPLIESGVPKERVIQEFITSTSQKNKRRQIALSLEQELGQKLRKYSGIYPGADITYLVVNHEVGLGSLVQSWNLDNNNWHIEPAEALTIDFKPNGWREYTFRGNKVFRGPAAHGLDHLLFTSRASETILSSN